MPLGNPLPSAEREVLRAWLKGGAPWAARLTAQKRARADLSWWSLQPLKKMPGATIDGLLEAAMAAKGLKRSPAADRRTLIRRVTFD
ncbi:MAG TPA: hypothetical protein DEH78_25615, partial [Solibacterales bacterium]|nr:hypothetical protein [Bryobacterales bacterium]